MDLPRSYSIREDSHRVLNPIDSAKLALLGEVIGLKAGQSMLDLCCGKGEALATWARDHGIGGVGVDISTVSLAVARERVAEFGVADRVSFVHGDASTYVSAEPVDVVACIGATWIGGGVTGTVALLRQSLKPGGLMLIGEPFWRGETPDLETAKACRVRTTEEYDTLPRLVARFGELGFDLVEMVLASEDSWDRYRAAQWLNVRRFLDANPDDELAAEFRAELDRAPLDYVRYERALVGWGVFALMQR
ncbi:SAM-dependent methyltransferase [Catellatospora tritici]|uniref:SAM-dependent methyltransferase n=1 Tax=Catellatospora tritici TaxID=2851566 RepID=UPI001C2D32BA|nr:methyltransferase domain-containing protein [Catellatospora tritici]MBV1855975.1 methyltransferase domain-containing protein [Catellatospora tritici]